MPSYSLKSLWAIFLLFCLAFLYAGNCRLAQAADSTFRIGSAYGAAVGSTVAIDVSVETPRQLYGCRFELQYNEDIIRAVSVTKGDLLVISNNTLDADLSKAGEGIISIYWRNEYRNHIPYDGELFRIYFKVLDEGRTALSVWNLDLFENYSSGSNPHTIDGTISTSVSGNTSPHIDTGAFLPGATRESWYSTSLTARGGRAPYTWSRISGSLPPGLSLSSRGTISGTPTSTGTYTFTVRITDDNYARQEKQFKLTITDTDYTSSEEGLFKTLHIARSTMKLFLTPEDMPYTMFVNSDVNWINLTIASYHASDWLRINGTSYYNGTLRTVPLSKGTNQITIGVSSDGSSYHNYTATIYRLP